MARKKTLKIVHICPYFQPELGYEEYYTAYFQSKMGHDVYVITSDRLFPFRNIEKMLKQAGAKNTSRKRKKGFQVIDGIKVYRQPIIIESLYDFVLIKGLKKVLNKIKPDIIQGHTPNHGAASQGAYIKDSIDVPFILDSHDCIFQGHVLERKTKSWKDVVAKIDYKLFRKPLGRYTMRKADRIIAVTPDVKDFSEEFYNADSKKIVVTSLAADTELYKFRFEGRERIRKKYGFDNGDVVLVFTGIISERKSVGDLIRIFSKIHKNHKNTKFLIVGDGDTSYMKELKTLAKKKKVGKDVVFTGFINSEKLPDYYSAGDIGVWLSNNSVVMMEAISCSLPLVIPDQQLSHVAGHDNGFRFEPGNQKQFQEYVEKLIINPDLRKKLAKNSRKAAIEHYSYKTNAERLIDLYYEVLEEKKKKRRSGGS